MEIKFIFFGGFAAQWPDGSAIELPTRKAEALLAYLACRAGEAQPRDRLTALLWGERADAQARHSLSQTLTSIPCAERRRVDSQCRPGYGDPAT